MSKEPEGHRSTEERSVQEAVEGMRALAWLMGRMVLVLKGDEAGCRSMSIEMP